MKKRICSIVLVIALIATLIPVVSMETTAASDPLVIVLDPGHGGSDSGAVSSGGITEASVNLKIATYMKEQLEEYPGVVVYMTRTTDTYVGISDRATIANSYDADLFISIHANSSTSSSANGAEVYYPNGNYISNYDTDVSYTQVKELAQNVQDGLTSLGLYNRGIKIYNASVDKYADGSAADYYGVIRYNKIYGIPAILIEHAFLSNSSDVSKYLSTDTQLKALATSNVEAIVETLDLTMVTAELTIAAPTTTTYVVGDTFDSTGLTVDVEYSDGTSATLSSGEYSISGFDSSSTGTKVVTVSYMDETAKFVVCILEEGADTNSTMIGDVNGDGEVKANDYAIIRDSIMEGIVLSEAQFARADVKVDGEIKATDYLMIKDYILGNLESLGELEEVAIAEEQESVTTAEDPIVEDMIIEPDAIVGSDEDEEIGETTESDTTEMVDEAEVVAGTETTTENEE